VVVAVEPFAHVEGGNTAAKTATSPWAFAWDDIGLSFVGALEAPMEVFWMSSRPRDSHSALSYFAHG